LSLYFFGSRGLPIAFQTVLNAVAFLLDQGGRSLVCEIAGEKFFQALDLGARILEILLETRSFLCKIEIIFRSISTIPASGRWISTALPRGQPPPWAFHSTTQ
jgi:hypothetical protein